MDTNGWMTGWLDGYVGIFLLLVCSGQMQLIIHWSIHVGVRGEMNEGIGGIQ